MLNQRVLGFVSTASVFICVAAATAQSPAPATFEVASVKPNNSGLPRGLQVTIQPGGVFNIVNLSLLQIIRMAYQLGGDQLVGGPDWIRAERFDVVAKAGIDLPPMPPPPRF